MASSSQHHNHPPIYGSDPTTPNTTFVQADPSSFRSVVQKLTGASDDPSSPKLPLTLPPRLLSGGDIGPKKTSFKRKMGLSIGVVSHRPTSAFSPLGPSPSSSSPSASIVASPVSPFEMLEERVIAEKRFFLHPTPITTPPPPELLPLFPVISPANNNQPTKS